MTIAASPAHPDHARASDPAPASVRTRVTVPLRFPDGYSTTAEVFTFHGLVEGKEHLLVGLGDWQNALLRTALGGEPAPLVRPHSECLTGHVFSSERCDCGPRLREAAERISDAGGFLVYLRQEGRGIGVPIGPAAVEALRRYLHLRDRHRLAHARDLWLGQRGRSFGYDGLSQALRRRAQTAGIEGFHPHKLRHTAAHRWLAHGGSESGLMAMAGWTRTDMLVRYTKARASERAAHEARRLNLGDL